MTDSLLGRAILELRTNPDGLRAGMAAARADVTRSLAATNAAAQAALARTSASLASAGQQMTIGITLPILAAGKAIVTTGADFDRTLKMIVGLAGGSRAEIAGVREEILKLGGETGRVPQELAEAFYFVKSAGFDSAEAMDVLSTSARAAAAGLGTTQSVAQVLGLTINAYGHENITAARAADILTAAVRDGTAESDAFAGVLGRVIPTAASLGVTFDQVTAALAGMTLTGLSADEAATSLNQVLVSLLKPTTEAENALAEMGLSSAELRKQLREEGLIATLRTLETAFGANEQAASLVFGNVRALRGALSLLGLDAEQLNGIFKDTAGAAGDLAYAYKETEGPARELDRSHARMEASLIRLSDSVLPVVTDLISELADGLAAVAEWFGSLPRDVQETVVKVLALAAALGPILLIGGSLGKAIAILWGGLGTLATIIFTRVIPALGALKTAAGAAGLAIAAVTLGIGFALEKSAEETNGHVKQIGDAILSGANVTSQFIEDIARIDHQNVDDFKARINDYVETRRQQAAEEERLRAENLRDAFLHSTKLKDIMDRESRDYATAATAVEDYQKKANTALDKALADLKSHTHDALTELQGYRTAIESAYGAAVDAVYDAEVTRNQIIVAEAELTAAKKAETEARKKGDKDEIASAVLRRIGILKELNALKLHAALIGDEMQQTTKLTALLTGKDMQDGLTSPFPEVKASYAVLQSSIIEKLRAIQTNGGPAAKAAAAALAKYLDPSNPLSPLDGADQWGAAIGASYISGIAAGMQRKLFLVSTKLRILERLLESGSPPKSPDNPLHFIDRWGAATGRAWVESFAGAMGGAGSALRSPLAAAAGVLGASFRGPSFAFAGGPSLPAQASDVARAAVEKHYHLTVQGDLVAKDPESVVATLRRMEDLS